MYLKEIQLENFKSFGRKMSIPFLRGFTTITGPNGSGKSNISDAILFVLGPRSAKAIRAGKLTDLIFNGGKKGRPAKSCKVTLVFDNTSRLIPIDDDEVRLTRLVKISDSKKDNYYSYFYVNGKPSSLNEFNDLLANAKISADGYNLVQQGDINLITRMTNLERRRILDDVAGITKFDKDIGKAEDKRKVAEENLKLIKATLTEIERLLKQLEKEKNDAIRYKEYKEKLDEAKAMMAFKRKSSLEIEVSGTQKQIEDYKTEREDLKKKLEELRAQLKELEKELQEVEEEIVEKGGDEAKELKEKIDAIRLEVARAKDVSMDAKDDIKEFKEENRTISSDLKRMEAEKKKQVKKLEKAEKELEGKKKLLDEKRKVYKEKESKLISSDNEVGKHQKAIIGINRRFEEVRNKRHELTLEKERTEERLERLRTELAAVEERERVIDVSVKDAEWRMKDLRSKVGDVDKDRGDLRKEIYEVKKEESRLSDALQTLEEEIRVLDREYTRIKTEQDMAEKFATGYTRGVSEILGARDRGELHGIFGTIAELGKVDKSYETALNIAAGGRLQSVVVENDEVASQAITFLKKNRLGRVTFLPLNKMAAMRPRGKALMAVRDPDAIGFAIDLVKFDNIYENAFRYVFGDTVVVKNLKSARKLMGGVRLVTLDGELIESSGAMVGGVAKMKLTFGDGPEADYTKVQDQLREKNARAHELREAVAAARRALEVLEEDLHGSSEDVESIRELKELDFEHKKATQERIEVKAAKEKLDKEISGAEEKLRSSCDEIEKVGEDEKKLETEKKEASERLMGAMSKKLGKEIRELESSITEMAEIVRDLDSEVRTLQSQIALHDERIGEVRERFERNEAGIKEAEEKIASSKAKIEEYAKELKLLLDIERSMNEDLKSLRMRRDELYRHTVELEGEIDAAASKIDTHGDVIVTLEAKLINLTNELEEAIRECEKHHKKFGEDLPSLEELKTTIRECEANMAALEPVNMRAIEDYEINEERRVKIQEEYDHLEEQRQHLIEVVEELIKKKKDGLMIVFDKVNENFKSIYTELSMGGEGELQIENKHNPFEGGLIIKAKPVNKKVLRLGLLSGGEKSLTALALIFAIQQYDPSPFYLLDEVDMFLDAVNAERVAKLVLRNSEKAQFIMITLRKVTIKESDHVYGITMQDNGITDIIGNVHISEVTDKGEIVVKKGDGRTIASSDEEKAKKPKKKKKKVKGEDEPPDETAPAEDEPPEEGAPAGEDAPAEDETPEEEPEEDAPAEETSEEEEAPPEEPITPDDNTEEGEAEPPTEADEAVEVAEEPTDTKEDAADA